MTIFEWILTCHKKEKEINVIMNQVDGDSWLKAGESAQKHDADLLQNFPNDWFSAGICSV